jgi:predicted solute-binding protein
VALRRGELDAGLLSITEALLHPEYDVLDGVCVASQGEVYSVLLAHRKPLEDVRTVFCHRASLTSVNLLRVLLGEKGLRPEFKTMTEPAAAAGHDFALLIGDPAIVFQQSRPAHAIWDLGAAWQQLTGLPFVYAAWILRHSAETTSLRAELLAAAERGRRELEAIIREVPDYDEAFRRTYLTRHTRHVLGPAEKAGIKRFVELLRRHLEQPVHEPRYVQ